MREVTIVAHHVGGVRGGMERQLTALIEGLLERGFSVTVVSRLCALERHPRLRWIHVRVPSGRFELQFVWFMLAASVAIARHGRGVLHTTGAIVLNRAGVSTIHFCHKAFGRRWPPWRLLATWAERYCYRPQVTRTLVAVSEAVATEDARVIPNGVDTERFRPDPERRRAFRTAHGIPEDTLVAAFVGGDWERKGLRYAIEGVGRTERWRLVVAGRGEPTDGATFLGPVPDPELLLAAADAFVFPSAYEAMPLVAYEAAACALPLLITRVGAVPDVVVDGESGWFVERDAADIARRLRALEDPALRAKMGAAARRRAEPFSWDAVVDAYAGLYEELAA